MARSGPIGPEMSRSAWRTADLHPADWLRLRSAAAALWREIGRDLHATTPLIAWPLMREIDQAPADASLHLAWALCPLDVSPHDFSQSRALIRRATLSTQKWIADGGLTRRATPGQLAPHRRRRAA